jgi:hypothetical protein
MEPQLRDGILPPKELVRLQIAMGAAESGDNLLRVLDAKMRQQQSWVRGSRQVRLFRELRGITEVTTFVHRSTNRDKYTIFMRHRVRHEAREGLFL